MFRSRLPEQSTFSWLFGTFWQTHSTDPNWHTFHVDLLKVAFVISSKYKRLLHKNKSSLSSFSILKRWQQLNVASAEIYLNRKQINVEILQYFENPNNHPKTFKLPQVLLRFIKWLFLQINQIALFINIFTMCFSHIHDIKLFLNSNILSHFVSMLINCLTNKLIT